MMAEKNEKSNNEGLKTARELLDWLEKLVDENVLEYGDFTYPLWLYERKSEHNPSVLLAVAHLCSLTRKGHVGAKLPIHYQPVSNKSDIEQQIALFDNPNMALLNQNLGTGNKKLPESLVKNAPHALQESSVIGSPESADYPLILDKSHIYFQRYWNYETTIAKLLKKKAGERSKPVDEERAWQLINELFSQNDIYPDWQKIALWISLKKKLLILSGGPGTGKTYTLIRLVALRYVLNSEADEPLPQVALAAPTGKAAARINESITQSIAELHSLVPNELLHQLPTKAQTIHRLLGSRHNHPEFRYNRENVLPHDILVIDEASMVDIALMAKLMEALKPGAQLILIGDKDQLASVEAGSVLGDICSLPDALEGASGINQFSKNIFSEMSDSNAFLPIEEQTTTEQPLLDCMVELKESRRFKKSPEIGQLAEAVNQNKPDDALRLLRNGEYIFLEQDATQQHLLTVIESQGYLKQDFETSNAGELFRAWRTFQTLCAHRRGPGSSSEINRALDRRMLATKNMATINQQRNNYQAEWYPGRPIMITANLYELNLFNGDIGITVSDTEHENQLSVCFEKSNHEKGEKFRFLSPAKLTHYESAWALTVHKSQGSEFGEVQLVLPDQLSPVLTRELIYTALTRSKNRFSVWGREDIFKKAIRQKIVRTGALLSRLWTEYG